MTTTQSSYSAEDQATDLAEAIWENRKPYGELGDADDARWYVDEVADQLGLDKALADMVYENLLARLAAWEA